MSGKFIARRLISSYKIQECRTKEDWLLVQAQTGFHVKPPTWWLESQALKGRSTSMAAIIWGSRYQQGRKMSIWAQAPIEDFIAAGYYEP